ncbi:YnfA family protein [Sulfurimonas paralvinellae]|uniref:YnfA family protein n=1 Tax=Sulfurimonas paralvinellae TaxID=317658 RepID=A0A7M1BAN4_9BACT|nr:YnfA family protein [Sulfurimonas paralvinellae]QOP46780.1 YnfA family protein [Sulfurimonas paralvinellae]
MITNIGLFFTGAFFEIFGCYSFWLYFKENKHSFWLGIGLISLVVFAYVLTKIDLTHAGRVYATYGGIYIFSSLLWLYFVENEVLNKWDIIGSITAFIGVLIIYVGNKS